MKKINLILSALALTAFFSCQKEVEIIVVPDEPVTFEATMPDITKTAVDDNLNVLWSAGDAIDVYGYTEGQEAVKAVFELTSGAGTKNGKFTLKDGESFGTYDSYYAVYPSGLAIKTVADKDKVLPDWITIKSAINTFTSQAVVQNGYDPAHAIMVAHVQDGKFQFTHGVCYFKVQIPADGITKVKITAGANAFQKRPSYSTEDGAIVAAQSGTNEISTAVGEFVKGSCYYLAAIPRKANEQKLSGITVTYTQGGVEKSVSSTKDAVKNLFPLVGTVYDLGCPPIVEPTPVIKVTNAQIEADATGGSISYSVENPYADGELTAVVSTSKTTTIGDFTILNVTSDAVSYSCSANTEATAKYGYVTFTYTYDGGKTVTAEGIVTQAAAGGAVPTGHKYVFYIDDNKNQVQKMDGVEGSYFTLTGTSTLACSASGYFGVDSFTIGGTEYKYAKKIDSSNNIEFTTSADATTTIRFYAANRQTKSGTIKLQQGSSNKVNADMTYGQLYDSGVVELEKSSTYKFSKSGEVGVFYVEVTEVSE